MKNICKFLGIIAAVAVIGFVTSCGEPDPDKQIQIEITEMPSSANDYFVVVSIYDTGTPTTINAGQVPSIARSSVARKISGGMARGEMVVFKGTSQENFDKEDNYFVRFELYPDAAKAQTQAIPDLTYSGTTGNKVKIIKGVNVIKALTGATALDPIPTSTNIPPLTTEPAPPVTQPPPANNFGTYSGQSFNYTVIETVVLSSSSFKISDNSGTGADSLNFRIDFWEEIPAASLPADATSNGYTGGYKFKGKILSATSGYLPSNQTAPSSAGFSAADANAAGSGPDCWMSMYFTGATGDITFIRTPFSKTSATAGVVKNNPPQNALRVYTKAAN